MWQATGFDPGNPVELPAALAWTAIVTSPLGRCRQFAEQLSRRAGIPLTVEPAWREIDYGDWDGMPLARWRTEAAAQFSAFRNDLAALVPPNGEAFVDFRDRVLSAWQALQELPAGSHVLLVTHGGVMRVVLPTVLGMPLNRTGVLDIPFGCLSRVVIETREKGRHCILASHNKASG